MYRGSNHLKEKDLLELLRQIVVEYEKQHTKRKRNDNKQYCQELVLEDLFDCLLELVLMISKFEFCDERNASSLTMLLRKLFMQDPRNRSGNTLLFTVILSERRTLELKCISAKAVKKFGIPYLGVVPKILENYISRH